MKTLKLTFLGLLISISTFAQIDQSGGNVGIGVVGPTKKLDIKLGNDPDFLRIRRASSSGRSQVVLADENAVEVWRFGLTGSGATGFSFWDGTKNALHLEKNGDILFDPAGYVGIGTNIPESKLHVNGDITFKRSSEIRISSFSGGGNASQTHAIIKNGWRHNQDYTSIHAAGITSNTESSIVIKGNGNVGIGTTNPQSKLAVDGQIRATEVKVLADITTVPDYVFESDYELRTLKETKEYITENKHLPEIPSAAEIGENGINLGEMDMRLLKKIEELTLYQIQLMEKLEEQGLELEKVKTQLKALEN